jgi:hypothetical protein
MWLTKFLFKNKRYLYTIHMNTWRDIILDNVLCYDLLTYKKKKKKKVMYTLIIKIAS